MLPSSNPKENLKRGIYTETGGYDRSAFKLPGLAPTLESNIQELPADANVSTAAPATPSYYSRYTPTTTEDSLLSAIGGLKAPSEEDIRQKKADAAQASIDAIRASFNQALTQESEAGAARNARTRALNVGSGLVGSDFASAAATKTEDYNKKIIQSLEQERDSKITAVLADVEDRASAQYQQERSAFLQDATSALQVRKDFQDRARADLKTIASTGASLDQFRSKQPDAYQKLLDQTSLSDFEFEALYNANLPTAAKVDYQYKVENGKIFAFGVDPVSGKMKVLEHATGQDVPANYKPTFAPDGTLLFMPDTLDPSKPIGEQIIIGGSYAKPESSGLTPTQLFDRELKLANDFEKYAKESRTAIRSIGTVNTGFDEAVAALKEGKSINSQTQAVVIGFNKLIDPTSVVRESEYARTPEGQSLLAKLDGKIQQIKQGGAGLTKDSLEEIKNTANALLKGYQNMMLGYARRTRNQADSIGANLENVLTADVIELLNEGESLPPDNLSDDDAYQEYLKATGQSD